MKLIKIGRKIESKYIHKSASFDGKPVTGKIVKAKNDFIKQMKSIPPYYLANAKDGWSNGYNYANKKGYGQIGKFFCQLAGTVKNTIKKTRKDDLPILISAPTAPIPLVPTITLYLITKGLVKLSKIIKK